MNQVLIQQLTEVLPADNLSIYANQHEEEPEHSSPLATVLPTDIEQIQDILKVCHTLNVAVITVSTDQNVDTTFPNKEFITVDLSHFNTILNIDSDDLIITIQPNAPTSTINQAISSLAVEDLSFSNELDILEITMVTTDGELITLGNEALDNAGLDLLALLASSNYSLGIVVELKVRLRADTVTEHSPITATHRKKVNTPFDSGALEVFQAIKSTFDPNHLLNSEEVR